MSVQFRNTRTGRVETMPEAEEVKAASEKRAQELYALGTKDSKLKGEIEGERGIKAAMQAGKTIVKMDESSKWQRIPAAQPDPEPEPEAPAKKATTKPKASTADE